MPLLREWNIGESALAAIWKVEEPEAFFNGHTGLYPEINNDIKRMEHLAGRFLLKYLERDFPLHQIEKDEHNKPRLQHKNFYFSISHSWPYIAAVIDPLHDTGIDIQVWTPRIVDIQQRFLSEREQGFCGGDHQLITLAWCAKEAVYKWYGRKGTSFMNHLPITALHETEEGYKVQIEFQLSEVPRSILLHCIKEADFGCVWIADAGNDN